MHTNNPFYTTLTSLYKAPTHSFILLHCTCFPKPQENMANQRVFTPSQVAQHKTNNDCWFVVNGRVVDVTKFLEEHPGGAEVLVESSGRDATKDFEDIGHSKAAQMLLLKYQVGVLEGFKLQEEDSKAVPYEESKAKEMSAFVIKDDTVPKYYKFIEFFVPLMVASSFFGYRYLTGATEMNY